MKKIIYIAIVSIFSIQLISCNEDLLDIPNPNTLTQADFWQTEDDARLGVNAMYAMFYKPGLWTRWMYFRLDLTSDEGFSSSPWLELGDWTRFQYINYNFWEGNVETWRDTYKAVWRANQVLTYVPDIEFQNNDEKNRLLAEAHFLRALHYYYAALLWENIPIVLEPSQPEDLPEQRPLEEVWAQIEEDLLFALDHVPVSRDAANVGRPTKGAVNAFLARTYMQQHKWTEARQALDYFFIGEGAGRYSLVPNYQDNFTHLNENNSESVFEIQFSDVNRGGDGEVPNATMTTHRPQFFAPNGIGWSDGEARPWIVNAFKSERTVDDELDPRLRFTVFYPDLEADFGDKVYGRNWEWGSRVYFRKYARDYFRDNEDYFAQNNFRMVRFADILLLYAEVLNELGETSNAYQYVNTVRGRANLRSLEEAYPAIGNNQEQFLERLKMERALELFSESVRWADLKRWGDLSNPAQLAAVAQRDPDFNNFVIGRSIRLPIPQQEVENNPNLNQNPQY
ncbi:RagB/SusD family nutrient uptake outer membrane protein [Belliella sp. DSM 111904]|uniref:RagB/SusD family nutrient uptake outer membrane protein n=1 Tax=Belliella filtrata TaxID=2923435 RepID=A0ABS9V4H4_9BACT|nr:RagB/SusD family nutrient uptake outer membrane protein [Belliella filtrata]MCH7411306.1 RagB/SusD family nutrient uptake outer membrane protein [Belliella filtrata]